MVIIEEETLLGSSPISCSGALAIDQACFLPVVLERSAHHSQRNPVKLDRNRSNPVISQHRGSTHLRFPVRGYSPLIAEFSTPLVDRAVSLKYLFSLFFLKGKEFLSDFSSAEPFWGLACFLIYRVGRQHWIFFKWGTGHDAARRNAPRESPASRITQGLFASLYAWFARKTDTFN